MAAKRRTLPGIGEFLKPLYHAIRHKLTPALIEEPCCSDDERTLLSLPVRLGGLGIINPTTVCDEELKNSKKMNSNLPLAIQDLQREYQEDLNKLSGVCKLQLRSERRVRQLETFRTQMHDA